MFFFNLLSTPRPHPPSYFYHFPPFHANPYKTTIHRSQAGKSYALLDLIKYYTPTLCLHPLRSIIYVSGHTISGGYQERLEQIALEMRIPLYLVSGGIHNPRFAKSWSRRMRSDLKSGEMKNRANNDDDKDDNDDKDERYSHEKSRFNFNEGKNRENR